jgi:hypothetical protein
LHLAKPNEIKITERVTVERQMAELRRQDVPDFFSTIRNMSSNVPSRIESRIDAKKIPWGRFDKTVSAEIYG